MRSTCSAVPARPTASRRVLGLRGGDAGELANLGVGQLAAGEGLREPRQRAEGAGHAHVLAGRARREPHAPGQPGGAGAEAIVPAAAGVELADEVEQASGGRFQMHRQLGDLVAQAIELSSGRHGSDHVRGESAHGESPPTETTLHLGFGATWEARHATIAARAEFLRQRSRSEISVLLPNASAGFSRRLATGHNCHSQSCQAEIAGETKNREPPPRRNDSLRAPPYQKSDAERRHLSAGTTSRATISSAAPASRGSLVLAEITSVSTPTLA